MNPLNLSKLDIGHLQVMCDQQGIDPGPVDGGWGPRTATALAEFARRAAADGVVVSALAVAVVQPAPTDLVRIILQIAGHYVGLVEVKQNTIWRDPSGGSRGPAFASFLRSVGWSAPQPYCAAFVQAVFKGASASTQGMTLGSVETYDHLNRLERTTQVPSAGCAFFMEHGASGKGHAGIVTGPARDGVFPTIEGNTDLDGSREGDGVYAKTRRLDVARTSGLHLLGFGVPVPA